MSEDTFSVATDVLLRSRARDLALAANAPTEADRLAWLRQAVNTTYELARREALTRSNLNKQSEV